MTKRVFITGADGFIGSHLAENLVRSGHRLTALAQYNSFGRRGWLDDVPPEIQAEMEIVLGDVRDGGQMRRLAKGQDVIMHLAALIAIPFSYHAPQAYVDTNITGTMNILEAARDHDVSQIIHTSTSEVYGTAKFVPITEEHPLQGQSPYSASKIGADQIALSFHAAFDLPVKVVRPFNTYGPRQSMRAVIPTVIQQILSGKKDIALGALTPTRDFTFVSDTAAGFIAAMNSTKGDGDVTNLGSGFEVSIEDMVRVIALACGANVNIVCETERLRPPKSEVERLLADNSKAKTDFGWAPKRAGLDGFAAGIAQTVEWFRKPENLAHYPHDGFVI